MSGSKHATTVKFVAFTVVMVVLSSFLFLVLGQYRTGSADDYSAVFKDASRLKPGDSVRVAGIRIGTVSDVDLRPDHTVLVGFDADQDIALTTGTRAAVRYLNLVGDRYLELVDGPGSTRVLPRGGEIPVGNTAPALDLDQLLGGLKPVIQGLNPRDVNALSSSLLQILQGQGDTLQSLTSHTASFTNTIADNSENLQQLIDSMNVVIKTLADEGGQLSAAVDRLEKLVTGLAADRDPIGTAITSLSAGTASLTDLLANAREPLAGTVQQLKRLAPLLDGDKDRIDAALQKAPENYRKLTRLGSYGSFLNYYLCGLTFRVSDLQGRTAVFPWIMQNNGRCEEP